MATVNYDPVARKAIIHNTNSDFSLENVHSPEQCSGRSCVIHNPSDHHMRNNDGLMERICEHHIGQPNPDSLAFFEERGIKSMDVHGCDGCCQSRNKVPLADCLLDAHDVSKDIHEFLYQQGYETGTTLDLPPAPELLE